MNIESLNDHEVFELLKLQDAEAWKLVYARAVLPEYRGLRSGEAARRWGVCAEELMGMLYEEMIGRGKIALYRDDGGSLFGWLRQYVRGFVQKARPDARFTSLDEPGPDARDDGYAEEKVSMAVSESRGRDSLPTEDPALRLREEKEIAEACFAELWRKSPMKAYVHLLKLRLNLSSRQIKDMLGISSEANVDQLFSRAVKDMGKLKVDHE